MAEVIDECEGCNDLKVWGNLADIVLGCDAPEQVKTGALQVRRIVVSLFY